MAEIRVVVQLSDAEYAALIKDVTDVFENESDKVERDRKLRMLLQYRGYMTSGFEEKWTIHSTGAAGKSKKAPAAKKAKKRTRAR